MPPRYIPVKHQGAFTNYERIEKLNAGGYGTVWACKHALTREDVAIKIFDKRARDGFTAHRSTIKEVEVLRELQGHDNIVKIHHSMLEPGAPVDLTQLMVMELCRGTLRDYVRRSWPSGLPIDQVRYVGRQLVEGLMHCHTKQITHMDFKPENVLLIGNLICRIADFGGALWGPGLNVDGICTPMYRPPEAFIADIMNKKGMSHDNVVRCRSKVDMWALGVTLYYLATGDHLFSRPDPMSLDHMLIQTLQITGVPDTNEWRNVQGIISDSVTSSPYRVTPPSGSSPEQISSRLLARIELARIEQHRAGSLRPLDIMTPGWGHGQLLDLLSRLLCPQSARLTSSQALRHPFFALQQPVAARHMSDGPPTTRNAARRCRGCVIGRTRP
uniref:Protein kinase domain-containing protein n=1 Tax=Vitrella brassicaformis TaxID=1169539 RepID=A0A7S1P722_9ALVE|mmetsp:Transcript_34189/g.84657  ORF Transcript_34189/g.84657 Transcript_34189/m.84657 type:complete len:386 (+) Transcript_34189:937-2094(+)